MQDELGHVERNWERETDGEGVQGVQEHPESAHVERVNNPRLRCRDPEPGGRLGEQVEPDDVGGNLSHENDGDGVGEDGRGCWMDDATSGARCDSRRVETRPLAREQADQHGQQEREPADVPEPSTPSQTTPRRHTNHPNPPRRRGKLKTSSRNVSQTRVHKRTHRNRTATSRPIQRVEAMRMRSNGMENAGERSGGAICENGRAGGDHAHYSKSAAAEGRDIPYMVAARAQPTRRRHGRIPHLTDAPNHMKIVKYILYRTTTCAMYATRAKEHRAKASSPASRDLPD